MNTLILDAFWVDSKPFPSVIDRSSKVGQILYSEYSEPTRYLGWMDLIQLKELVHKSHISHIILKNLDILGKMAQAEGRVKICCNYITRHHFLINKLPSQEELKYCTPFYMDNFIGGWDLTLDDDYIPYRAKTYMTYILVKTGIKSITYSTNKVKFSVFIDDETGYPRSEMEQFE